MCFFVYIVFSFFSFFFSFFSFFFFFFFFFFFLHDNEKIKKIKKMSTFPVPLNLYVPTFFQPLGTHHNRSRIFHFSPFRCSLIIVLEIEKKKKKKKAHPQNSLVLYFRIKLVFILTFLCVWILYIPFTCFLFCSKVVLCGFSVFFVPR